MDELHEDLSVPWSVLNVLRMLRLLRLGRFVQVCHQLLLGLYGIRLPESIPLNARHQLRAIQEARAFNWQANGDTSNCFGSAAFAQLCELGSRFVQKSSRTVIA